MSSTHSSWKQDGLRQTKKACKQPNTVWLIDGLEPKQTRSLCEGVNAKHYESKDLRLLRRLPSASANPRFHPTAENPKTRAAGEALQIGCRCNFKQGRGQLADPVPLRSYVLRHQLRQRCGCFRCVDGHGVGEGSQPRMCERVAEHGSHALRTFGAKIGWPNNPPPCFR